MFLDAADESADEVARHQTAALLWLHFAGNDEDAVEAAVDSGAWEGEVKAFKRNPAILDAMAEVAGLLDRVRGIVTGPGFQALVAMGEDAKAGAEG